jgi:hypothetical protein
MHGFISSVRRSLFWGAIAFGAALAVVIGVRLEQAALTVVVGLACGVGASIPTSLLIVALFHRNREGNTRRHRQSPEQATPMIVVTPQTTPQTHQIRNWPEEYTLPVPNRRRFSIIGDEEETEL